MKIQDIKAAMDKEYKKLENLSLWDMKKIAVKA